MHLCQTCAFYPNKNSPAAYALATNKIRKKRICTPATNFILKKKPAAYALASEIQKL